MVRDHILMSTVLVFPILLAVGCGTEGAKRLVEVRWSINSGGTDEELVTMLNYDADGTAATIETVGSVSTYDHPPQVLTLSYGDDGLLARIDDRFGSSETRREGEMTYSFEWSDGRLDRIAEAGWWRLNDHEEGELPMDPVDQEELTTLVRGGDGKIEAGSMSRTSSFSLPGASEGAVTSDEDEYQLEYRDEVLRQAVVTRQHTYAAGNVDETATSTVFIPEGEGGLRVDRDGALAMRYSELEHWSELDVAEDGLWTLTYDDDSYLESMAKNGERIIFVYEGGSATGELPFWPEYAPGRGLAKLEGGASVDAEPVLLFGWGGHLPGFMW